MKVSNLYIYGDKDYLKKLEEDYVFMGRQVKIEDGRLIVFALQRRKKPVKQERSSSRWR